MAKKEQVERIINILAKNSIYDIYGEKAILGLFGYSIPCEELPTDVEVMVDVVLPAVYEKVLAGAEERCYDVVKSNIIGSISRWVSNCDSGMTCRKEVWVDNARNLYFYGDNEKLAFYMKLRYYDLIFQRKKEKSYPFEFVFVNNEYWLNVSLKRWSSYHVPLLYNGNILCDDFGTWVKKMYKKFEVEHGMHFDDLK